MNRLFQAQTINGTSPEFPSEGRFATIIAKGDWNGAVLVVEASPDKGQTWVTSTVQMVADGVVNFITGRGVTYRAVLNGAGVATNVNAWLTFEI